MVIFSKKGAEWPAALLSTVFSLVLLILGTMMIVDVVKSVEVTNVNYIGHINYYALASRIMNSPDCAAWEEQIYTGTAYTYVPHLGIIDASKFTQDDIQSCISGNKFSMTLSYNNKNVLIEKNADKLPSDTTTDIFPVKVLENGVLHDGMLRMAIK